MKDLRSRAISPPSASPKFEIAPRRAPLRTASVDVLVFDLFFSTPRETLRNRGVYFEFGAQNGVKDSATLFFETYFGWSGTLVEPSSACVDEISLSRSANVINAAVCGTDTRVDQTVERTIPFTEGVWCQAKRETVQRRCPSLGKILEHERITHIDFLIADTEGGEIDALMSIDWTSVTICVMLLEWRPEDGEKGRAFFGALGYQSIHVPLPEHHMGQSAVVTDELYWRAGKGCEYIADINLDVPSAAVEIYARNGLRHETDRFSKVVGKMPPSCKPDGVRCF